MAHATRPRAAGGATGLKSLGKAIRVLQAFSLQEPRLPLTEIARRTGLPLSTTHRILTTLREAGLIEQEAGRELYRLGLKLLELGSMVLANMEVHREALPFIEELARETGETVHLGVFDGTQVVSIEKIESPRALASHVTIGKGAPAYCTGVGKALLAFQPEPVLDAVCRGGFVRYTAHTIVQPARLRRELARVRAQGYAVDNAEHQPDVRCVAAPVRDHSGRVVASLSVSGPATRLPRDRVPALAARTRAVAARLSSRLGYRSP
jgi:DNA-binding IclR family transcriptional regulator